LSANVGSGQVTDTRVSVV